MDNHVVANERINAEERPFKKVTVVPWPHVWNPRRIGYRLLESMGLEKHLNSSWRQFWPGAEDVIEQIAPDILHAHFGRAGVKAVPIARRLDLPLVVTFYGYDISQLPREQPWREAYEGIWETAEAIVVLSEDMKRRAVHWGAPADKVHVVHLARDLEEFSYRAPELPLNEMVSVGRLTEKKGHFDAIEAVGQVVEKGREVRLKIVGDGPLRNELERCIRTNDLEENVQLLGARSNSEVAEILAEADAFLLCSKTSASGDREGTPAVLIEAQAVGLPCVSTTHAGIPEMIPESNHQFLAEEGDVDGLATCLCRLLDCSEAEVKQVAEAGREKIERDFQLSREVKNLKRIYEEIT